VRRERRKRAPSSPWRATIVSREKKKEKKGRTPHRVNSLSMKLLLLLLVVLSAVPAAVRGAGSLHRLLLDKADIRQLAHDTGVASLLEREGHDMALGQRSASAAQQSTSVVLEIPSMGGATPEEVQAGDFEIKCATKCDFVKSGQAEFADGAGMGGANGAGKAAVQATQVLEGLYEKMAGLQDKLAADPTNEALVGERQKMQAKINSQVALLNAVAGGGALEAPVNPNDAAHLEALKEKLKTVSAQLNDSPDDKPLTAMRDQLRSEIADRQKAVQAEKALSSRRAEVEAEVAKYDAQLDKLKAQAGAVPNDAKLADEISRVEKAKQDALQSQSVTSPKSECLIICNKARTSGAQHDDSCVRTCITTMRAMSYKMAKMFL
jgi:hypothetical protein